MVKEEGSTEAQDTTEDRVAGMQWVRFERYPFLLAKLIFFALLIAGAYWALEQISAVIFPIFMALLLAYILNPTVGKLESKGVPRTLGIGIITLGLVAFVVVFSAFLYPTMASQVRTIGERAPQAWEMVEDRTIPWIAETLGMDVPNSWAEILEHYGEELGEIVPTVAQQIGEWTGEIVTRTRIILVSLFNLVMIPIFLFYFLRDFERGKRRLKRLIPPGREEIWMDRLRRMDFAVGQWFRGQLQVSGILAVLYAIGLGVVYWATGHDPRSGVVIGLLTGFLNVIPYLGFAVGSLLAFLVVLIEWTGWWAVIGVALAFTVIQTVESYYITPRVMGDKVGLNPAAVIIVLLIGGHVAGLLGVLLAIPVAGAIKVLIPDVLAWYRRSAFYSGEAVHPAVAMRNGSDSAEESADEIHSDGGGPGASAEEASEAPTSSEADDDRNEGGEDDGPGSAQDDGVDSSGESREG